MKMTNLKLRTLGYNLRLDEARVEEIISSESYYDLSEQHQRLIELWFRQDSNPTWEKLRESLPSDDHMRRSTSSYQTESSTSMISVPTTPLSPTGMKSYSASMTFNALGMYMIILLVIIIYMSFIHRFHVSLQRGRN